MHLLSRLSDGARKPAPDRAPTHSTGSSRVATELLRLQRSIGNRALARTVGRQGLQRQAATDPSPQSATTGESDGDRLQRELIRCLDEWKREAEVGVENFADAELMDAIKDATSFNAVSFLGALVGNVIWAGTCFISEAPAATFALSLAGISIGAGTAIPSPPKKDKDPMMTVKKGMLRMLDQAYRHLHDHEVPEKSAKAYEENHGISVDDALEKVLRASLRAEFLLRDDQTHRDTELNDEAIRTAYQEEAAVLLEKYKTQVEPIGKSAWNFLCWINPGGLAVVEGSTDGPIFLNWVDPELAASAVAQAKALGGHVPTWLSPRCWASPSSRRPRGPLHRARSKVLGRGPRPSDRVRSRVEQPDVGPRGAPPARTPPTSPIQPTAHLRPLIGLRCPGSTDKERGNRPD